MSAAQPITWLLAAAVALASARMLWRWRRADAARARAWRLGFLLFAQALAAWLLYRTLFPPALPAPAGTLVVLAADAGRVGGAMPAGRVVALPEAARTDLRGGAERVPDLATALRAHPGTGSLVVLGAGLPARDLDAARGLSLRFAPAPLPRAIVELRPPPPAAPGRSFAVHGRVHDAAGGSIELLDPAGRRIDRATLDEGGAFALHGSARAPGLALFAIRLRDARGRELERLPLPQRTLPATPLRALALAGAPDAELKFLRRWADDAGVDLATRIALGAGMQVRGGDARLDDASLDRLDLLLVDARSWGGLGAPVRARVLAAVDRGMGLLLRLDAGAGANERALLRGLGFGATAGPSRQVRLGAGFVRTGDAVDALPALTRAPLRPVADDGVAMLSDARGEPLASWRARGRGRIGVAAFDDSYRLALAGRGDAHGELWSRIAGALARARAATAVAATVEPAPPGERSIACGLRGEPDVLAPGGTRQRLRIDPRSGAAACAAFWASAPGWHLLRHAGGATSFLVPDAAQGHGLRARALREQTRALAGGTADPGRAARAQLPGPRWPWFAGWLLIAAAAWWLERSRLGLSAPTGER